jgi:hypothetical protein
MQDAVYVRGYHVSANVIEHIDAALKRITAEVPRDQISRQHIIDAIGLARSEGANIEKWLRAKILIAVFASAAEAEHTQRTIRDVWTSYAADSDLKGAFSDGSGRTIYSRNRKSLLRNKSFGCAHRPASNPVSNLCARGCLAELR